MSEFALLKRIARNIRYRELENVKNKIVEIKSYDHVETTAISIVKAELEVDSIISYDEGNPLAFLKYGLFDLTIEIPLTSLNSEYRTGIRVLADMNWLDNQGYGENENDSPLMELWDDIQDERAYVRLYLRAKNYTKPPKDTQLPDMSHLKEEWERKALMKLLSLGGSRKYEFPNTFGFQDAFVSNVRDLGLMKNFYL